MRKARINPSDAPEIQKQLSFAKTLSSEIRKAGKEKKNSKQNIRSVISGKILRKYKLIHYTARRTNTDRRKLSEGISKVTNPNKSRRGFEPNLYKAVINFYNRGEVSTALPGKRNAKKVKQGKPHIQKWVLNDYLSNLHQRFVSEHTNMSCSFTSFARMRPKDFVLGNFANRKPVCARNIKITLWSWKCSENKQPFKQTQKHLSNTVIRNLVSYWQYKTTGFHVWHLEKG